MGEREVLKLVVHSSKASTQPVECTKTPIQRKLLRNEINYSFYDIHGPVFPS